MHARQEQRLYQRTDLVNLLQLSEEQVGQLIRTGQLRPIRICGEERIDSRELEQLIGTYRQIAQRRTSSAN